MNEIIHAVILYLVARSMMFVYQSCARRRKKAVQQIVHSCLCVLPIHLLYVYKILSYEKSSPRLIIYI